MVERSRFLDVAVDTAKALHGIGVSMAQACTWLGVPRSTFYRHRQPRACGGVVVPHAQRAYPNRLTQSEQAHVLARLNAPDVMDMSIRQAYFHLLDQGTYLCSLASMHRIMRRAGQCADRRRRRERRGQVGPRHAPRLEATAPGQVWCWDITNLPGPGRVVFKLYTAIDLYSRYVVAHRVEHDERPEHSRAMFTTAFAAQRCTPAVIHADNGAPMRAGTVRDLFATLHITASYSRPRVSNDNAFAESLFKTVKYDLSFPDRFDSLEHARAWTGTYFHHYNTGHHHAGLAGHPPQRVHDGTWPTAHQRWQATKAAYAATKPARHPRAPITPTPPQTVWINKPNHPQSQTA